MNLQVLIVDDSLTVRMDLEEAFTQAGFQPTACADLAAARRALERGPFALAVLDILLPDGDGLELLKEIKSDRATALIPIMLLSTEAEVHDRIRGMATGADDYVGKPYDRDYVIDRARELVRRGDTPPGTRSAPRVLIIEDSLTFREELAAVLRDHGYEACLAETGEEGLRLAVQLRPDLVVIDGLLPGIDGPTVVQRLRCDASLCRTPCLLLTGSGKPVDELTSLEAGADAYVHKHEGNEVILARLAAMLRTTVSRPVLAATKSLFGPKRILAVDDSFTFLQELTASLQQEEYDVVQARSGQEALQLLKVQPVDCILLDLVMPGLAGDETCLRIKMEPAWRDIPLVMMTARDDREAMIGGFNAGADDFVTKSSEFAVLKARLRAQLRRKQYEDENRKIREELLRKELEAAEAQTHRELAETRARLVQELERTNKAKDHFLATMSHELRTPLNAILGFTGTLLMKLPGPLSEEQEKQLLTIRASARHLLSLINDILDLAKIESGRVELHREPVGGATVIEETAAPLQPLAEQKGVRLVLQCPPRDIVLHTDRRALSQVLINLMSNAIKFTDQGSVTIRLDRQVVDGRASVVIAVQDTGVGISAADQQKLFQGFVQLESSGRQRHEGTGLGLHLSRQLVRLLWGDLTANSEVGKGSTFTVLLPES